jgi:hypothetical protein
MIGLSNGNTNNQYNDIDFGIYCNTGIVRFMEKGYTVGQDHQSAYIGTDVLEVRVLGSIVQYRKNGVTLHTSEQPPAYPLAVDVSINTNGGQLHEVAIQSEQHRTCLACPAGKYQDQEGATTCHGCAAGQYQEAPAATACVLCAEGLFSTALAALSSSTCSSCAAVDRCQTANAARDDCSVNVDSDCTMTAWSSWGGCSTTCNEGDSGRTRAVILPACHGGFPCENTQQSKICMNTPCECEQVTF